jgi:nucleotide-binding universal stress UspA family protein
MISKILVPSDGSKTAKRAAVYAVDLAKQLKASIIILSVIDQRALIAKIVPASATPRHTIEPIEDYLKEAKRSKAELIIMGSHGRSALSATVLGSVSYGVIHNDKRIHVLIVRG